MSDRPAKRLKKDITTPTVSLAMLPPRLIFSEILIHIVVGVDIYRTENDIVGPDAKWGGCFGRPKRWVVKYSPFAIFRSIAINPAFLSLTYAEGNDLSGQPHMVLPLRYMKQFTVPSFSYRQRPTSPRIFLYLQTMFTHYKLNLDNLKIVPGNRMPQLTTISSLLIRTPEDRKTIYPDVTTIVMQSPMPEIPNWCERLHIVPSEELRLWEFPKSRSHPNSPWWVGETGTLLDTLRSLTRHFRENLSEIVFQPGYIQSHSWLAPPIPITWDMHNLPNLRKFVISVTTWDPQFLDGVGSYYDFLRPLNMLDELKLKLRVPTDYKKHWFLPEVRKRLKVTGFTVPPGYVFPFNSEFRECRFDPQHTYLLPPGGVERLAIHQETKYDAPHDAYKQRPLVNLHDMHGRITIAGNVRKLKYSHMCALAMPDPQCQAVSETDRQYVIDQIGLPYEFVFNGDIDDADINPEKTRRFMRYVNPDTSLVRLNGWTKNLVLHNGGGLRLFANRVTNLRVLNGRDLRVAIDNPVLKVHLMSPLDVRLKTPNIDEFVCGYGKSFAGFPLLAKEFTIHGPINRAFVKGGETQKTFDCTFDRVAMLSMESCIASVRINHLDAVQSITFTNVMARDITFIWPDTSPGTPAGRIPNEKLHFVKMTSRETSKLRMKLTKSMEE